MFLNYYDLREQPFGVTPDPRFLYFSPSHREALASLYYGIEMGRGFLALVAEPGTGKTTLLFHLLEKLRGSARTAFIFRTQCNSREFLRSLMADLGYSSGDDDLIRLQERLNEILIRESRSGGRFVLVVDEAQNLTDSVLETVRMLSNFETSRVKLIQILLVGQPQLADKLASSNLVQLRQRVSILSWLNHLSPSETAGYVTHRLRVAGYNGKLLFTPDALAIIASGSGGIPRNINNICFQALTLGFAREQPIIREALIEDVLADLDVASLVSDSVGNTKSALDSRSTTGCPSLEEILAALDTSAVAPSSNAGCLRKTDSPASRVVVNQGPALHSLTADWAMESRAGSFEGREEATVASGAGRTEGPVRRTYWGALAVCLVLVAGAVGAFRLRDRNRLVVHAERTFQAALTRSPSPRTIVPTAVPKPETHPSSKSSGSAAPEAKTDPPSTPQIFLKAQIKPLAVAGPAPSPARRARIAIGGADRKRQRVGLSDKLAAATYYYDLGEYDLALHLFEAALRIDPSSDHAKTGIIRARLARRVGRSTQARSPADSSTRSLIDP